MKTRKASTHFVLFFAVTACAAKYDLVNEASTNSSVQVPQDAFVCDPFDSGAKHSDINGTIARLHYLDSSQPQYNNVRDYFQYGHSVDGILLFIHRIFVPTRPFDRGFATLGGDVLRTPSGDALYEWFAINLQTRLGLASGDAPGDYQLATISDDGSILSVGEGASSVELINNDGFHSTRMRCATQPVRLDASTRLPARFEYFQGPRNRIAMIIMWRPWTGNPNDPACDQTGGSYFFDATQNPSQPTQNYLNLPSRGWRPLEAANYFLPDGVVNPCQ